jgi:hypothetical protein
VPAAPLHRNRGFLLVQTGLLLSVGGSQMTAIAYPLLVLTLTTIGLAIAPLGPLVAGLLLESMSARAAVAVFAAAGLALALWGTLSGSIRAAPSLGELAELPAR